MGESLARDPLVADGDGLGPPRVDLRPGGRVVGAESGRGGRVVPGVDGERVDQVTPVVPAVPAARSQGALKAGLDAEKAATKELKQEGNSLRLQQRPKADE